MVEIRHALRRLRNAPLISMNAIACLAIGIWMACIVSAAARGFFRPDLDVRAPEQLVQIDEEGLFIVDYPKLGGGRSAPAHRFPWRTTSKAVTDSLAARKTFAAIGYYWQEVWAQVLEGEQTRRRGIVLSSGMMDVLQVDVVLGRRFLAADDSVGSLIISERLWRTRFGGDSGIIGRRIHLNNYGSGSTVPIVGVMPASFTFPRQWSRPDLYLSAGFGAIRELPARTMLARLRAGTEVNDVRSVIRELAMRHVASDREALTRYWRDQSPREQPQALLPMPVQVSIERYYTEPIGQRTLWLVLLILACGLAVVLIAAANVANLLLVRGAARRKEIAVRMALGAARLRVLRELVIEAGLLCSVGIVLGFLAAFWQWRLMERSLDARGLLGAVDGTTFIVAIGAGLVLTLAVGVWPGLRATSTSLEQVLREAGRAGIGGSPLDNVLGRLVAASTAMTVMLLACTGIMYGSARGWVNDNVITERQAMTSALTLGDSRSRGQRAEIAQEAVARLRGFPGVRFAVLGTAPTDGETKDLGAAAEGGPVRRVQQIDVFNISDGYFAAMGIRMLAGRGFTLQESRDSTTTVVLSALAATTIFPGQPALGRRFRYWSEADSVMQDGLVVGVAENLAGEKRQLYRPFGAVAPSTIPVLIGYQAGSAVDPAAINKALRVVPGLQSTDVVRLEEKPESGLLFYRQLLMGFALFAVVGVVLATIGTYGIVAYSVERRTHEIGVRIALGAQRSRIAWMIVEQGLKVTLAGIAFGLMLSFAASRVLATVMIDTRLEYGFVLTGVVSLVVVVSVVACLVPGIKAGSLDPVGALRAE
jgi:putative ABC transport system permease protein